MKNVEIKAKCLNPDKIREFLKRNKAKFIGLDYQVDTYFNVQKGRLKLREGNIENHLIFYHRQNTDAPKRSDVILYDVNNSTALKQILAQSIGIKVVVKKSREIYFIKNVKFHIDTVEGLGSFVEIEAQDYDDTVSEKLLFEQCQFYLKELDIAQQNLISHSYSDMLLKKQMDK